MTGCLRWRKPAKVKITDRSNLFICGWNIQLLYSALIPLLFYAVSDTATFLAFICEINKPENINIPETMWKAASCFPSKTAITAVDNGTIFIKIPALFAPIIRSPLFHKMYVKAVPKTPNDMEATQNWHPRLKVCGVIKKGVIRIKETKHTKFVKNVKCWLDMLIAYFFTQMW